MPDLYAKTEHFYAGLENKKERNESLEMQDEREETGWGGRLVLYLQLNAGRIFFVEHTPDSRISQGVLTGL